MSSSSGPPANRSHLQRLANAAADVAAIPVGRYQRWINVQILSAVLDRVRDEDGDPLFALKGGAAMELRLGLTARASKDYDAVFRERAESMLDALDRALSQDWQGFQLERSEPRRIGPTRSIQIDIKLAYKGKSWGTVQLEISPAEGDAGREVDRVPARPLDAVRLEGPERIACVSIRYQIAQKLHACTQVREDGEPNDRFRDVIDLLLLRELIDDAQLAAVREASVEIFTLRDTHMWPPAVTVWPDWAAGFAALAAEIQFYTEDVSVAVTDLELFVAAIDAA